LSDVWREEDGYIYRKKVTIEKVKIPEGYVKCPICNGYGEVRRYYGQPWDKGQFMTCWVCHGKGYVKKEFAEDLKRGKHIR
jgi:DnaJ-class molecular chaperone